MSEVHERIEDEIELFDLGDVTVETKQFSEWPIWFDSVFLLGAKDL
jgi:hypothetical protein